MKYDYKAVEAKWQKVWEDEKTFHAEIDHKKPKFYALVEFPYPSGAGLHVGHPRSYTALDVVSRKRRQNGYNVLYPMGWDIRPSSPRRMLTTSGSSSRHWASPSTGTVRSTPPTPSIISGPSGSSCSCTRRASPTRRK